jgi:hypothetical protein
MRVNHGVDLYKYERIPIADNIPDIEKEIDNLRELTKDQFLSPIEQQLIIDRIERCTAKIKEIHTKNIKITPVIRTSTIGDKKRSFGIKENNGTSIKENKAYIAVQG